ncbi:MAG: SDR family oxidoreductase [Rhodospirillaceae bacterium]|jgi:nucleoside-diphosphate-sugar epimerase|nr:SDR family oxidoreductase [Rhodospirillaceae bacterium]MBT4117726.1 SDR family oxidoreductase [Rhodospirillaceae bacterium]MBT4672810.1 SDR family oxidoreductase [Rhodospirillaceae bacterium]MBT4719958.1 SDR family oxidoreductase [Rhodospirillaceae bacterium]MBT4748862.1 SDR family oxidoreductase [Rhodospirillaceae bacterium]
MGAKKTILVTGGAGYVGGILIPKLLNADYAVRVFDRYIYGKQVFDGIRPNESLTEIEGDIRDLDLVGDAVKGCDAVIHLACISNDPSADLDPALTKSINLDCFPGMVKACKSAKVPRFIFASSSSVYGISDAPQVREDHDRIPVTDYNRYKASCEDILADEAKDGFGYVSIRPATVCGYSPRLRLDLSVNVLTTHAVVNNKITVFGGTQYRPNLHIQDMTDLYLQLLEEPDERVADKIFNAGYQNMQMMDIAKRVKSVVGQHKSDNEIEIITTPTDDIRSYRINCDKIEQELGFVPKHSIENAVEELCAAFSSGMIPDPMTSSAYVNIKRMQEIGMV